MSTRCENICRSILRDWVQGGKLAVGEQLPTTRDLATHYDVSLPTVNKAVALLAAEGWLTKRHGSGIFIAAHAEGKAAAQRADLGFVAFNLRAPLAHRIFEGVEYVARSNHWSLGVSASHWSVAEEHRQIGLMRERGVAGIVLYPGPRDAKALDYLGKEFLDYPIVVVDLYQPWMKRPHVVFDNFGAGREMTRYLIEQGRRDVAFLKFDDAITFRSVDDRLAGYRRALEEANLPFAPERILQCTLASGLKGLEATPSLRDAVNRLLALRPRPTAIIAIEDTLAHRVIRILRSQGVAAPQEIMVAGFDNVQEERWGEHFPSTQPDFMRMGERATEMLLEIIHAGQTNLTELVLPCPLIVPEQRESAWASNAELGDICKPLLQ